MLIPDPNFSIPNPGSERSRILIRIKEFKYFNPKKFVQSSQKSVMFLPDPGSGSIYSPPLGSRIQAAPDPGSGYAKLMYGMLFRVGVGLFSASTKTTLFFFFQTE
jgi:hypothetical protein